MRLRRTLVFLALAAAAMLAAQSPARADDYKGWFVYLDLASTQPNSLDQFYANTVSATNQVQVLSLDNDADFSWKLGGGYSWGKMGMLKVSYWTFDNEDKESGTATGLYMTPTVFGYGAIYGYSYLYSPTFETTGEVKATTFDVDYARPFSAGEKMTISWLAGLRVASYEETQTFTGTDALYTYDQDKHFEKKGWGPRIGVNVEWGFTERFSLGGTAAFSFMQVETQGDASQSGIGAISFSESLSAESDYQRGLIMDFDLRAIWSWDKFGVWFGYEMSDWGGISTSPFPSSGGFAGPMGAPESDDVSFNSWHAGVKWKFGGG